MKEFDVIERFFLGEMMPDYVSVGPGDDCAVLSVPPGFDLNVSTDTLVEGVHFPIAADPRLVSGRSLGANLSDLAAMGAVPHGMTIALTLPAADETWLSGFVEENQRLTTLHHCPIVGGNLAKGPLSVCVTVMGITPTGQSLLRSGAKQGDAIYVSGKLGSAAGAVAQFLSGSGQVEPVFWSRYETPEPRLTLGQKLLGIATSAIDISDGLLADLGHILAASKKGARLNLTTIPQASALLATFGASRALELALTGGDDYELCFTASAGDAGRVRTAAEQAGVVVTQVGIITDEVNVIRDEADQVLTRMGYEHFSE